MLSVHGIEGIGVGAHINEKEIKIKVGTQEGGKRGKSNIVLSNSELFTFKR